MALGLEVCDAEPVLVEDIKKQITDRLAKSQDAQLKAAGDRLEKNLSAVEGEIYQVKHDPRHRWFYVSALREDEALLVKCYDSALDGRARFAPHSAFEDPTTPPDAPPRESIELRAFVFY